MKLEPRCLKAHVKFSLHPSGVDNYYCPVIHRVESGLNFDSVCLANPAVQVQELSSHARNLEKELALRDRRTGLSCRSVGAAISRRWCLLVTSLSSLTGIPVCIFSGKGCKSNSSKDRQATGGWCHPKAHVCSWVTSDRCPSHLPLGQIRGSSAHPFLFF